VRVGPLDRSQISAATAVLAAGCAFDRAAEVADEKLFGASPRGEPRALGAWDDRGALVGVASVGGSRIRVLAVTPAARGRGVGSALLAACEADAKAAGEATLRTLDQPGNYLAPGIDERNTETITWLERRGWVRGEERLNVLIDVRDNPRVTAERAAELVTAAAQRGYEVRRARADETALLSTVTSEFGGAWPFELERALAHSPAGVHVAIKDGAYCAFAAHDGNNRGLGWFGPTGTSVAHRGQGLGEALLVACLVDVAANHAQCEVAWIGPRPFYDKVAGVAADRRFVLLTRAL